MDSDTGEDQKSNGGQESAEVIGYILTDDPDDSMGAYKQDSGGILQSERANSIGHNSEGIRVSAVNLPDGMTTVVQSGQTVQLEDGTTAFIQTLHEKETEDVMEPKFIDGQAVQLEDGTTAFIHTAPKDGLQAVQLEDGTTAYIAGSFSLENYADSQNDECPEMEKSDSGMMQMQKTPRMSSTKAMALGEKAFRCLFDGCGRLYTTQHHLKVHERSHTGDRPFKCGEDGCNKAFATGYGLKSHTRVHTGEKPYKCVEEYCDKAFKTSGDLQKHVRTHTGERPFKCPFEGCDRSFTTSNIRKVHVRTHTGERPYICPEEGCGRGFASATNYKNHIRIHTGEKPYVCTVQGCGKRFTEYSSLYKHHVVHTSSKPYICSMCGKNYRQTSTLAMHMRSAHGIETVVEPGEEGEGGEEEQAEEDEENAEQNAETQPSKKRQRIQLMVASTEVNDPAAMVALQAAQRAAEQAIQHVHQQQAQIEMAAAARGATPQILVVTDPAQFAALQQLSQEQLAHITSGQNDGTITVTAGDSSLVTTEDGSMVAYPTASM